MTLAYLDPGSGSGPMLGTIVLVLIVAVILFLLGATIYAAVRPARRD